ncbi:MAG: imidazole glycerol phosphate synthase subunit HisH, partial [Actinomycetota bacterium]
MSNLANVSKALERIGVRTVPSTEPSLLDETELLVLPGVGNFAAGMANLRCLGLDSFVRHWAEAGRPVLGICLGMQLLFERSEEGDADGLGVLPGEVVRIRGAVKVPHMGWNTLEGASGIFAPFDGRRFYFVHSYACVPSRWDYVARTAYG